MRRVSADVVDAAVLREHPLPDHGIDTNKHERGSVLVVGGSRETPGGVLLAGVAALRAGAGRIHLATAQSMVAALAISVPEARVVGLAETVTGALDPDAATALVRSSHCDALLLGTSALDADATAPVVRGAVERVDAASALVLDAAALARLTDACDFAPLAPVASRTVAMPNPSEMARLLGCDAIEVDDDPDGVLDRAVDRLGVTVLLRGAETRIATPGGDRFVDRSGHPTLATSGSGDVVAGALTGLLARGADPLTASLWAVHAHATAGRRLAARGLTLGVLARELLDELPAAFAFLRT